MLNRMWSEDAVDAVVYGDAAAEEEDTAAGDEGEDVPLCCVAVPGRDQTGGAWVRRAAEVLRIQPRI